MTFLPRLAAAGSGALPLVLMLVTSSARAVDAITRFGFDSMACTTSFEFEPNDVSSSSNVLLLEPSTRSVVVCGTGEPSNFDYFELVPTAAGTWVIETIKADGAPCVPGTSMTIQLYDASGYTELAADTDGGEGSCASLDGIVLPALQNLPAGHYYVGVTFNNISVNDPNSNYVLRIKLFWRPFTLSVVLPNERHSATKPQQDEGQIQLWASGKRT